GSVLNAAGIALINGMQAFLGETVTSFGAGNIILGGDGSDIIEGRGGDDLLDGDRPLRVRLALANAPNPAGGPVYSMKDLVPEMLAGTINPSQLSIMREIVTATIPDFDTAMFHDVRA